MLNLCFADLLIIRIQDLSTRKKKHVCRSIDAVKHRVSWFGIGWIVIEFGRGNPGIDSVFVLATHSTRNSNMTSDSHVAILI